jgi:hypothetical protein
VDRFQQAPARFAERGDYDSFFERYNKGWLASQQR